MPNSPVPYERNPLQNVPGIRIPAAPGTLWTTFTHTKSVKDRNGITFNLAMDAAGQQYLDIRSSSRIATNTTRLFLPITPRNLPDAVLGRKPLLTFIEEADWVFLTHTFRDPELPPTVIMARPTELLKNLWALPHTKPPGDLRLKADYQDLERWEKAIKVTKDDYSKDPEQQRTDILGDLNRAFSQHHLEDGTDHPAEDILIQAMETLGEDPMLLWLSAHIAHPESKYVEELIICLGRIPKAGTPQWRASIVEEGLRSNDLGTREAALGAADAWQDPEIIQVLRQHQEPDKLTAKYIRELLQQAQNTTG